MEWRIQEGSVEREREVFGGQSAREQHWRLGEGCWALAESLAFFLCATDKQNKIRARNILRGRHLCFHLRVRGQWHVSVCE